MEGIIMNAVRKYWLDTMLRIVGPVLECAASGTLREKMPVFARPDRSGPSAEDAASDRANYTYLEALGRTVCGIAPWLSRPVEDREEEALRLRYAELARGAISSAVMPGSPDHMNFTFGGQPIVDAAFLAEGILRAPEELYCKLDGDVKRELILRMKETRTRKPYASNWLLFSAMIEAFLHYAGEPDWDMMRVDYALRQHMQWYLGDGFYGDGPEFHLDYYNSYVISPMLVDVINSVGKMSPDWEEMRGQIMRRAGRFASAQESMIAHDGTYPVLGRSSAYRFGAFHALAAAVLGDYLPKETSPAAVRCALTAVIERVTESPDMFDPDGWLTVGVYGYQPMIGEGYISTGSLYLCLAAFLPLGLPESDAFWSMPDEAWTQKRIWSGDRGAVTRH